MVASDVPLGPRPLHHKSSGIHDERAGPHPPRVDPFTSIQVHVVRFGREVDLDLVSAVEVVRAPQAAGQALLRPIKTNTAHCTMQYAVVVRSTDQATRRRRLAANARPASASAKGAMSVGVLPEAEQPL